MGGEAAQSVQRGGCDGEAGLVLATTMKSFTDQELEALLDDTESDRIERKRPFKGDAPKKARQAVCAFANDLPNHNQPGILLIGAEDDGTPAQEPITDELLRDLSNMRTDGNILPLPV